jgi:2-keto-3-deoxy-6-phosphogluconate aldolase
MNRGELIQKMHRTRLVAVVRSKSPEEALATANAIAEGGIKIHRDHLQCA